MCVCMCRCVGELKLQCTTAHRYNFVRDVVQIGSNKYHYAIYPNIGRLVTYTDGKAEYGGNLT